MTDEISIKSARNLKRNLAPVSASTFRLTRLRFAQSFATIARCIVRLLAKCCAKLSHAISNREKRQPGYQRRHRLTFLLHQQGTIHVNGTYRTVRVLIITIDYAYKKRRPPRVSGANKAY